MRGAKIQPVFPDEVVAVSSYTPAVLVEGGRALYISGQVPADPTADMETQIREVFKRIGRTLEAAGGTFENLVMVRAYFVNMARDLATFRRVRTEFLQEPYPASTLVGVTSLAVANVEIEVEAVAAL